jgi:hypothetical protein
MILTFATGKGLYLKNVKMKKLILFSLIVITGLVMLTSCGSTRRGTGCPGTEGIIH